MSEMLWYSEARALGLDPYAVYGGKVYSLRVNSDQAPGYRIVAHGTPEYAALTEERKTCKPKT